LIRWWQSMKQSIWYLAMISYARGYDLWITMLVNDRLWLLGGYAILAMTGCMAMTWCLWAMNGVWSSNGDSSYVKHRLSNRGRNVCSVAVSEVGILCRKTIFTRCKSKHKTSPIGQIPPISDVRTNSMLAGSSECRLSQNRLAALLTNTMP